jgi:hypothetical protein
MASNEPFSDLHDAPDSPFGRVAPPAGAGDRDLPLGQMGWGELRTAASVVRRTHRRAVKAFLAGKFAASTRHFVLATSAPTRASGVQDAVTTQRRGLRESGIEFAVWGRERLSEKLHDRPDLLLRFIGAPWRELYRPDQAQEELSVVLWIVEMTATASIDEIPRARRAMTGRRRGPNFTRSTTHARPSG